MIERVKASTSRLCDSGEMDVGVGCKQSREGVQAITGGVDQECDENRIVQ